MRAEYPLADVYDQNNKYKYKNPQTQTGITCECFQMDLQTTVSSGKCLTSN